MPTHKLSRCTRRQSLIKFPQTHTHTHEPAQLATHKSTQHFLRLQVVVSRVNQENREMAASNSWRQLLLQSVEIKLKRCLTSVAFKCAIVHLTKIGFFGGLCCRIQSCRPAGGCCQTHLLHNANRMPTPNARENSCAVAASAGCAATAFPVFLFAATNSTKMPDTPTKLRDGARPANRVQPNVAARTQTQVVPTTAAHQMPFKLHYTPTHTHTHTHSYRHR